MDRITLNNEIVLCRSAVRKARVRVTRKTLKKIKILRSCKNEADKEKKMNKADKLYNRIQIIKKLKDDDVTKFALMNENYEFHLKNSNQNMENAAMASLAKHQVVSKAIIEIRKKFNDWKKELPLLLVKKKKLKVSSKVKNNRISVTQGSHQRLAKIKDTTNGESESIKDDGFQVESGGRSLGRKNASCTRKTMAMRPKHFVKGNKQPDVVIRKIDDPFFVGKKMIAPRTIRPAQYEDEKASGKGTTDQTPHHESNAADGGKRKESSESPNVASELHPSWAAKKKGSLVKPFQGKKTKFSDSD